MKVPTLAGKAERQDRIRHRNTLVGRLIEIQTSATWRLAKPIYWLEQRFPTAIRGIASSIELLSAALRGKILPLLRLRRDVREIYSSGLFDSTWYIQRYPEAALTCNDPVVHYLTHGAKRGYWPSQHFDPVSFLAYKHSSDVITNPLLDYLRRRGQLPEEIETSPDLYSLPLSLRDKIIASRLFDPDWYIATYSDVRDLNYDPLFHYIKKGWCDGYAPSERFNGQLYLQCHPEVREAGLNPLLHFILYGDRSDPSNEPFANCSSARQAIVAMIEHNCAFDPQLDNAEVLCNIYSLCCYDGHANGMLFDSWNRIFSEIDHAYDRIVCIPRPVSMDRNPFINHIIRAVVDRHGEKGILLIITDSEHDDHQHLSPLGVDRIVLSDYTQYLTNDDRAKLVEIIIRALKPKAILNIGSIACWEVIRRHGMALSSCCDFYVLIDCRENSLYGRVAGNEIFYFRDCIQSVRKLYTNNAGYLQQLIKQFGIPNRLKPHLVFVPQPVREGLKAQGLAKIKSGMPLQVFWVGPFDSQNNIEILLEIVTLAANIRIDIYGSGGDLADEVLQQLADHPGHIRIMGAYTSIEAIPTAHYSAFLFTAQWDGVPSVLLEVAALGVPIVASDVAGIGELIDNNTGWLIHDYQDARCYVDALEQIRRSTDEAQRRVDNLVGRIETLHTWPVFLQVFSASPSFID